MRITEFSLLFTVFSQLCWKHIKANLYYTDISSVAQQCFPCTQEKKKTAVAACVGVPAEHSWTQVLSCSIWHQAWEG